MLKVSCLCATYNRAPRDLGLVEEAIESFLRQDYPNKELIVLNDTPGQTLCFEHPQVRIVNVSARFPTLGEKRNAMAAIATGDLLCPWDDDDIHLPWRITKSVEMLGDADYYMPWAYWFFCGDMLHHENEGGEGFQTTIFRKSVFEELGGYPSISLGEDKVLHAKFAARKVAEPRSLAREEWFYIYRWGVSPAHLSGVWNESFYATLGEKPIVEGTFVLEPHWRTDYSAVTRAFAFALQHMPRGEIKRTDNVLNSYFDRIFVLNLLRSVDRRQGIMDSFARLGIGNFEFIEAVDGKDLDVESLRQGGHVLWDDYWDRDLTPAEIGCNLSHQKAWTLGLERGYKRFLVCEDDAVFADNSHDIAQKFVTEVPGDWDILHFFSRYEIGSGAGSDAGRRKITDTVYQGWDENGGAVCYALTPRGASRLLTLAYPMHNTADGVTNWLTGHWPDAQGYKGYVCFPFLVSHGFYESTIR